MSKLIIDIPWQIKECLNNENEWTALLLAELKDIVNNGIPLEQEPKTGIALERYKDLQDYFSDEEIAKSVLENQKEFKAWLERLHWNTRKVDELARKLEELEQNPILDKIRAEIAELRHYYPMGHDYQIAITRCIADIDKYKAESEEINGR